MHLSVAYEHIINDTCLRAVQLHRRPQELHAAIIQLSMMCGKNVHLPIGVIRWVEVEAIA